MKQLDSEAFNPRLFDSRLEMFGATVLVVAIAVGSQFLSGYHLSLLTVAGLYALAAMGLNLLTGNTGLISIAHAAYMGVGAFSTAYLTADLGWPPLPAVLAAGLIAAIVGLLFGLPSLRLKGVYLVIASFAAQVILYWFFEQARWLTKGPDGRFVERPHVLGLDVSASSHFFLLVLTFAVIGGILYLNIRRSSLGRSFEAVREHPIAAQLMGINLVKTKLIAFAIGHFYAGVAGGLYGWYLEFIAIEAFSIETSIQLLALIIIGGLGRLSGAVLGSLFIVLLPEMLDAAGRTFLEDAAVMAPVRLGVFGLLIIVFLLYESRGLARLWQRFVQAIVQWTTRTSKLKST